MRRTCGCQAHLVGISALGTTRAQRIAQGLLGVPHPRAGAVYLSEPLRGSSAQTSTLSLTTCLGVEKQFKVALETKHVIFLVKMKAVNFKPNV